MTYQKLKSLLLLVGLLISIQSRSQTVLSNKTVDWLLEQERQATFLRKDTARFRQSVIKLEKTIANDSLMFNRKVTQYNLLWNDYEKVTGLLAKSDRRKEMWKRGTIVFGGVALFETILIVLVGMVLIR